MKEIVYKLGGCDHAEPSKNNQFLWECIQQDCDGVHHYMVVSPWRYAS